MKLKSEFERETGYKIDKTHPVITTYWHFYEEVREEEYFRNYSEWLENHCTFLTNEDARYIYSFMPVWVKEQPEGLDAYFYGTGSSGGDRQVKEKITSILGL